MPYRKRNCIFAALAVWYETYESLHKPSLVTAPPIGQCAKVLNTSCISKVPLCAILDQFCIWFCLFRFSSFSVGCIFTKIGSGQTQTQTKPHKYNYWILFSRKALTVLLAKTPNRKWPWQSFCLLTRGFSVYQRHIALRTSCTFLVPPTGQKL